MTFAFAVREQDWIQVWADFSISDPMAGSVNDFPGRLKLLVLAEKFSVAYAGGVELAEGAVGQAALALPDTEQAIEILAAASSDDVVEFLVAQHTPDAQILKVSEGRVSAPLDFGWIGSPISEFVLESGSSVEDPATLRSYCDCSRLRSVDRQVRALVSDQGAASRGGVGRVFASAVCDPIDHWYANAGHSLEWTDLNILGLSAEDRTALRLTGAQSFEYNFYGSWAGQPHAGLYFPQARLGYEYGTRQPPFDIAIEVKVHRGIGHHAFSKLFTR